MNIVGVFEVHKFVAAINTNWTGFTSDIEFGPTSIWAHSSPQMVNDIDTDDASAETFLARFVTGGVPQNVHIIGVFASNCTRPSAGTARTESFCTISRTRGGSVGKRRSRSSKRVRSWQC